MLDNAKTLRSNQAEAEQRLWYHLRAHRFMGLKFERQKPMSRFREALARTWLFALSAPCGYDITGH